MPEVDVGWCPFIIPSLYSAGRTLGQGWGPQCYGVLPFRDTSECTMPCDAPPPPLPLSKQHLCPSNTSVNFRTVSFGSAFFNLVLLCAV